jgi:hypothetical protein
MRALAQKDALSGLLFIGVAALGLWISRDYPIGTALRMGTGYVPRLLCWILLGLGTVVFLRGLRQSATVTEAAADLSYWQPLFFVTAALIVFGLTLERLGLVVSILLIGLSLAIFSFGLGLTIPVWPQW